MPMNQIPAMQKAFHECSKEKGFYSDELVLESAISMTGLETHTQNKLKSQLVDFMIIKRLALINTEVSEALEAIRKDDLNNFKEELADIVIRTFDLAEFTGTNLEDEIQRKMIKNKKRPYKHNKKF